MVIRLKKNITFYRKFVEKRANVDLIAEDALRFAIINSGGILRDLFRMLLSAALQAKINGHDKIIISDVEIEYQRLRDSYATCISSADEVERIKGVYSSSLQAHTDEISTKLFRANILIECQDEIGKYCIVHPAVIDYYKMVGIIETDE